MIKRIFSKKSGFTLVEIVIAFAVFAIMAAAIMQILNLVSYEKSENAKFLDTLEKQEAKLAADGKQEYKDTDGKVELNFKDKKTPDTIDYDMKAANGDEEGVGDGLVYFVSKKSTEGGEINQPGGSGDKAGEQGQMSAVDARITGSTNFDYIVIDEIKKAGAEYTGDGVCYYIQMHAFANKMTDEEVKYAQFRLNFFSTKTTESTQQYTTSDGKVYTRQEPMAANIIDAGYVNISEDATPSDWGDCVSVVKEKNMSSGDTTNSPFCVTRTVSNTLRISSPYVNNNDSVRFNGQKFRVYVVFDEDPNLSFASFGYNGKSTGKYNPCPIYKEEYNADGTCKYNESGKTSNYIYGANMYKRNYK